MGVLDCTWQEPADGSNYHASMTSTTSNSSPGDCIICSLIYLKLTRTQSTKNRKTKLDDILWKKEIKCQIEKLRIIFVESFQKGERKEILFKKATVVGQMLCLWDRGGPSRTISAEQCSPREATAPPVQHGQPKKKETKQKKSFACWK